MPPKPFEGRSLEGRYGKEAFTEHSKMPAITPRWFLIINHNRFKSAPRLHGNGNVEVVGLSVATDRKDPSS